MRRRIFGFAVIILLITHSLSIVSQEHKVANAIRAKTKIKVDAILEEKAWDKAPVIENFTQYVPHYKHEPRQKTQVKILYNDNAIFIAAYMLDSAPDSILRQLGNRDDELNADVFGIQIDTYSKQSDAYCFEVTASGVQADWRIKDRTYDAVWESDVAITQRGWLAELRIPYSAFRFPKTANQEWRIQVWRRIRRNREIDQWAIEEKGTENNLVYWGKLTGINNIKTPTRLAVTPYISGSVEHYPYEDPSEKDISYQLNGGMDLKYGFNESYTLDMVLLPDFSQVQSDNVVKNLSAFETIYSEKRPFFKEAVELFEKGGLFYSRRIGGKPESYDEVEELDDEGYDVIKNPEKSNLINALKVSGRNDNGMAIGFMNAITARTHAKVRDSLGNKKEILTNPLTNYNISVIDQNFKNNSSFYVVNSNTTRDNHFNNANVSASGVNLVNNSNTYQLSSMGGYSQIFEYDTSTENYNINDGYKYKVEFEKISGNFKYEVEYYAINDSYNANDLGITHRNNYRDYDLGVEYNIYEPFWKLRELYSSADFTLRKNFTTEKATERRIGLREWGTFLNYLSVWLRGYADIGDVYDYYEPRVEGRYYLVHPAYGLSFGSSSDYRKKFALDINFGFHQRPKDDNQSYNMMIRPILRVSDKLSCRHEFNISQRMNEKGYVDYEDDTIFFGNREVFNIENIFNSKYMFKNDLSLSLRLRHYWSKGTYNKFYILKNDGNLLLHNTYSQDHDFNFNSFNVDLVFNWQFAPGSSLNLIWKNNIYSEDTNTQHNYWQNVNDVLSSKQKNIFSIKLVYYLDYNYIFGNKSK